MNEAKEKFIAYLQEHYEHATKETVIKEGCNFADLTIKDCLETYNELYKYKTKYHEQHEIDINRTGFYLHKSRSIFSEVLPYGS